MGRCVKLMMSAACLLVAGCYGSSQQSSDEDGVTDGSEDPVADLLAELPDVEDAACDDGLQICEGECVDTLVDNGHCGACEVACGPAEACLAGSCVLVCEEPWHRCGDVCVDLATDGANCGVCGAGCSVEHTTMTCVAAVCTVTVCDDGWYDVNGDPDDGCEYECTRTTPDETPVDSEDDACWDDLDNDCDSRTDSDDPDCTYTPPESCNGMDDDCDTLVDEDFDCGMGQPTECLTACGSTGSGTCTETCEFPPPTDCSPPVETCNGVDDDCDGTADEDC